MENKAKKPGDDYHWKDNLSYSQIAREGGCLAMGGHTGKPWGWLGGRERWETVGKNLYYGFSSKEWEGVAG